VLTLTGGTHSTSITMVSNFTQNNFVIKTGNHIGSFIIYT
jgi:hypothetical protein